MTFAGSPSFSPPLVTSPTRCATACLLTYLAMAFPDYALLFQFLITLDFSSHYMHMYRSARVTSPRPPHELGLAGQMLTSPAHRSLSLTASQLPCDWLVVPQDCDRRGLVDPVDVLQLYRQSLPDAS